MIQASGNAYYTRLLLTPSEIPPLTPAFMEGVRRSPLFETGWGDWIKTDGRIRLVDESIIRGPDWVPLLYKETTGSAMAGDPVQRMQLLDEAIPALSTPIGQKEIANLAPSRNHNMPQMYADKSYWPVARGIDLPTGVPNWFHSDLRDVAYVYVHLLFGQIKAISEE